MNAKLMLRERHVISEISFVEMVVWHLPAPLSGSSHRFKYRLALVVNGICVLRYDNEAGKGDHKHKAGEETNMNAKLMLRERHIISEISFVEMVVWHLPAPFPGAVTVSNIVWRWW